MRTVGKRQQYRISQEPSAQKLMEGAHWNDSMHRLTPGFSLPIQRGVYRYRTHEEADAAWQKIVTLAMAELARRRNWHD